MPNFGKKTSNERTKQLRKSKINKKNICVQYVRSGSFSRPNRSPELGRNIHSSEKEEMMRLERGKGSEGKVFI